MEVGPGRMCIMRGSGMEEEVGGGEENYQERLWRLSGGLSSNSFHWESVFLPA